MTPRQHKDPGSSPPLEGGKLCRYRVLDTYRFLAASGVVFYHFEGHFAPFLPAHAMRLERFQAFVDFFFVLSGFVLMHTYGRHPLGWVQHREFLWKRFARLYPLHLATILLCCLQGGIVLGFGIKVRDPSFFDPRLLPSNLLLVHAWGVNDHPGLNAPSWSLSAEAFVYLLFPLLVLLLRRLGSGVAVVLALAAWTGTVLLRDRFGWGDAALATYDFGNLRALPSFLVGMATCSLVEQLPVRRIAWAYPHALFATILALMLLGAPTEAILVLFPVLVGLVALAERGGADTILASPACVTLGHASLAIYLTHSFLQIVSVTVVRKLGLTSPFGLVCVAVVFFVAIVASSVLSYFCFEGPARRALLRRRPFVGAKPPQAAPLGSAG